MSISNFFLILLNTFVLVTGQFLWKFGIGQQQIAFNSLVSVIRLLVSPFVMAGLIMYGFATVLWLFILTKVPLSVAYPIQSIAYVIAVFGAYFIFHESLSVWKIVGVLFIIIGVSFIGVSASNV